MAELRCSGSDPDLPFHVIKSGIQIVIQVLMSDLFHSIKAFICPPKWFVIICVKGLNLGLPEDCNIFAGKIYC